MTADEIAVLGEDTSLREEFTKQYTLENGAKMAVVYPSAVHYEENGAWQDIDNRLNETTASYTVAAHAGVPTGAVVSEAQAALRTLPERLPRTQRWTTAKRWISPNRRCATPRERSP